MLQAAAGRIRAAVARGLPPQSPTGPIAHRANDTAVRIPQPNANQVAPDPIAENFAAFCLIAMDPRVGTFAIATYVGHIALAISARQHPDISLEGLAIFDNALVYYAANPDIDPHAAFGDETDEQIIQITNDFFRTQRFQTLDFPTLVANLRLRLQQLPADTNSRYQAELNMLTIRRAALEPLRQAPMVIPHQPPAIPPLPLAIPQPLEPQLIPQEPRLLPGQPRGAQRRLYLDEPAPMPQFELQRRRRRTADEMAIEEGQAFVRGPNRRRV